jgi:hypothetical protein
MLLANDALNLLLRSHANVFQELAKRHVKVFIFHFILHRVMGKRVPLRKLVQAADPDMIRFNS